MDMKGIDSAGAMGTPPQVDGIKKDGGRQSPERQGAARGDRVNVSPEARELLDGMNDVQAAREIVMDAARKKMLTGDLLNPDAIRKAAENLLNSDELDDVDAS